MSNQSPSIDRVLGVVGILGGVALLLAFVTDIPSDLGVLRLVLFFIGSIAVTVALALRASLADRQTIVVASVAVALNVASIAMVVLSIGRDHPFGGDFGLVWFWIAFATWLADAAVGLLAWRQRHTTTIGALVLAIGSVLAILGMDRLGLSSAADVTVFGSLGLLGVALNSVGWVLIGLDLVFGPRPREVACIGRHEQLDARKGATHARIGENGTISTAVPANRL